MTIGDVTSNDRGSGARFNDGKPDYSLIPLVMIGQHYLSIGRHHWATLALIELGHWQTRDATLLNVLDTIGTEAWPECARVFDYGRNKYAAWNWAKGMPWSVPLACAARHLIAILDGEDIDQESKLPHRGHVVCNLVMLMQFQITYLEGDDRAPEGLL